MVLKPVWRKQARDPMEPIGGISEAFAKRAEFVISGRAFLFPYSDISTYTFNWNVLSEFQIDGQPPGSLQNKIKRILKTRPGQDASDTAG